MKANVINGEVKLLVDDARLALFPPHIQAEFVEAPDWVEVGDHYDGTEFSKPTTPG